eukprot:GFUD01021979.1.p1 GENE.GFUD01021979.1~~GFUD01021979.1.p1  ORF type:complete len:1250 (+),score=420.04 GFUD01021979.1:230-3979(+)
MGDDKIIPVKVAVRIRPLNRKENNEGCQTALEVVENEPQVFIPNTEKSFTYDYALGKDSTNEELYTTAVRNIVKQLFSGYNVTVLAYGQTGSGKTHSMGTAYNAEDDPILEGVIPRSVKDIFKYISENTDSEFLVKVSFMELYNEQLFDLLSNKPRKEDTMVDIREDGNKGIKIPGLTETPITSVDETMKMLEKASEGRVTAATAMNARSSRSHAIFTLGVEAKPKADPKAVTISKFHLVDLAGSERQKKTKAKGDRLKEGININMGLLSLGNVISALGEENRGPNSHIPYRDSKLTRLLQDSLGGNSHTLMIACVSPADSNLEETVSTLRYADRARKIKNKPIVNKDPKAAELGRLRSQVQQLQLQLIGAAGGINVGGVEDGQASHEVSQENQRLEEENGKLTSALQAAMEDNAHMSEKLLMSELANEKLKLKLTELSSQAEQAAELLNTSADATFSQKELVAKLKEKVEEVRNSQKQAEKTMMDHDISRFAPVSSQPSSPSSSPNPDLDTSLADLGGATHVLKQTELASQLAELNKVLVAKQELAGKIGENDEKMTAMRKKYEETLKSMEVEISRLHKEKDELAQQQRAGEAGGNGKTSEMRRKRIQELEGKIAGLNKQQLEQQRLLKLNSQNEAKVKKYSEEILQMKVVRVKLIKQMKEENEKVRVWKASKEKEVNQLKQKERRAQVAMSSMSQKHERRENVLKRKMEEANATTKRLKDALAKKEAVRKQKAGSGQVGLTGAGDRVRGWLSSEMDVVVTVKEAEKSKVQLLKERKSMTEELNKLKADLRRTTTSQEREEAQARQEQLQSELDLRNAQISDLQQQIMGAEQDKEKDKESKADRWTRLVTMVEAKLALQYLFNQATEALASVACTSREMRETTHQYEDLKVGRNELRDQVTRMKMNHEDEIVRLERDHEERVLFLLRQLPGQEVPESQDVSLNQELTDVEVRLKFQAEEIAKMSALHDQLLDKDREVETLKAELHGAGDKKTLMPRLGPNSPLKKDQKKRVTIAVERITEEEFFSSSDDDDSEEEDSESDSDPEWRKTPMFKRIKAERRSMGGPIYKRKRGSAGGSEEEEGEEDERPGSKKKNSSKNSSASQGCTCTTGCKTKRCSCRKAGPHCTALCKCNHSKCAHREVPGTDVSSAVETDKENASMNSDEDEADNTNKLLLDSTFDLKPSGKLNFSNSPATPNDRSPLKPIFKTPVIATGRSSADMFAMDSDVEATPTNRALGGKKRASIFQSPQF